MEKITHEYQRIRRRMVTNIFIGICVLFFAISGAKAASAASLYFSPSSGSYTVGGTLSVSVNVSSADQAMNAASGVISFPQDKLEVTSLSKNSSIFTLWVQEPSFSNSAGTVNFEGIVLNPGFTGTAGKIITVNFKVKTMGVAQFNFSSGSVLANDGLGTDILTSLGNAQFSLEAGYAGPAVGVPAAPRVSSPTHPDPSKWYNNSNPKFIWSLSDDATAVRILYSKNPDSYPSFLYTSPISEKQYENLNDGIWYFHVQLRNANGWGKISHFRFQIDTQKPSRFDITEIPRTDLTEPKAKFIFDAQDETSGIDYFEVQIDSGSAQIWRDDGTHQYETTIVGPGKHVLIAKAVDKAGNSLDNSAEFIVNPLNPPIFTEYPKKLQSGEPLVVRGSTYPNSQVTVWLQREGEDAKSFTIPSDQGGKFIFAAEGKLSEGTYKLWAEVADARGARSLPSDKITILVTKPAIFCIGTLGVSFLAALIPAIALLILLLIIIWYRSHKFFILKKRVRKEILKEVIEAEVALHKAFDLLRGKMQKQVEMLEKARIQRQLTQEEEEIIKQLKKDLGDIERFVRKEIEDIEKEVR